MIKLFSKGIEKKENPVGESLHFFGIPAFKKENIKAFVNEGYKYNPIVYRAIKEITTGISDIEIEVHDKNAKLVENHPVLKLLKKPNPGNGQDSFLKNLFVNYLITGEMYVVKYPLNSKSIREIWALNPLNMNVMPGKKGLPEKYVHKQNNKETVFQVDQLTGQSDIFCFKSYNPTNYWRGMSPLEAAAIAGDTHNEGMKWNNSLLKNGARPSGILKYEDSPSQETISFMIEWFKSAFQGGKNAGEVPIISGGEWIETQTNPKDMDYIKTLKEMAKYIASAYGVPLPLIDNDSSTFNNLEQAKERLWTDTILPLFNEFLVSFGNWIMFFYETPDLSLKANLDDVLALEGVRQRTFERFQKAVASGILSIDEARQQLGWSPVGGMAEKLLINASVIPLEMIDDTGNNESG